MSSKKQSGLEWTKNKRGEYEATGALREFRISGQRGEYTLHGRGVDPEGKVPGYWRRMTRATSVAEAKAHAAKSENP